VPAQRRRIRPWWQRRQTRVNLGDSDRRRGGRGCQCGGVEVLGGVAGDTENRRQLWGQQRGRQCGEVGMAKGDDTKEGKEQGRSQNVIDRDRSGMRMQPGTVSARVGPAVMRGRVHVGWVTKIIHF
jgi:hypothetical protein